LRVSTSKRTKGLCLWDWNGTIQDDLHHIYECGVQRIFREFDLPCPSIETYKNQVTADFMNTFYYPNGIPATVTSDQLNDIMAAGYKEKGTSAPLFPDATKVIRALQIMGYEQMLVTGYATAKLAAALERSGLADAFTHVVADVRDKPTMLRHCIYRSPENAAKRLVKIGDTVDDALAAYEVAATPYICPRGFHPRERIEAARASVPNLVIIDTLEAVLEHLR
jgi:phosphoglycolate phosphatase-like HAD superfamily hydrolase